MSSFFIQNFGCRVNQAEAFAWARELQEAGIAMADDRRSANVIVINSCTLTHRADRDVRKFIQKASRECPEARIVITGCYVEREQGAIAAMPGVAAVFGNGQKGELVKMIIELLRAGTLARTGAEPLRKGALLRADEATTASEHPRPSSLPVDPASSTAAPATEELSTSPARSTFLREGRGHVITPALLDSEEGRIEADADDEASFRARALVKVQDGCNHRCAFCVIPSVRGRSVSVPEDAIAVSIADLSGRGYREIVLAGIHLSSWGEDLVPRRSLTDLLRRIEAVKGLGRVRLSSLDPRRMDDEFVAHIADNPKICQHFHLSLQHASDRILKRMGRGAGAFGQTADACAPVRPFAATGGRVLSVDIFPEKSEAILTPGPETLACTPARPSGGERVGRGEGIDQGASAYLSLLRRLRDLSPDSAIGADIIIGFPEETDEDFATLENFLKRSPLTYFHVFSYSPRRGTPAAGWKQVMESVKKVRSQTLRRLSAEKNFAFRQSLLGRDFDAVVIRRLDHAGRSLLRPDRFRTERFARTRPDGHCEERSDEATSEVLTGNYIKVTVPKCAAPERELVRVRITWVGPRSTNGELTS